MVTRTIKFGNKRLTIYNQFTDTLDGYDNSQSTDCCINGKRHRFKKYVPWVKLLKYMH